MYRRAISRLHDFLAGVFVWLVAGLQWPQIRFLEGWGQREGRREGNGREERAGRKVGTGQEKEKERNGMGRKAKGKLAAWLNGQISKRSEGPLTIGPFRLHLILDRQIFFRVFFRALCKAIKSEHWMRFVIANQIREKCATSVRRFYLRFVPPNIQILGSGCLWHFWYFRHCQGMSKWTWRWNCLHFWICACHSCMGGHSHRGSSAQALDCSCSFVLHEFTPQPPVSL